MFDIKPYPAFTWSLSRHKSFLDCRRKYAYDYYFGHNGWHQDANSLAKNSYRLKKITNLEMLFGNTVHDLIFQVTQQFIKTGYLPPAAELVNRIRNVLNTAFLDSMKRKEHWAAKPKYYKMLHEIYYSGSLPAQKVQEIQERLAVCIDHFFSSKTFTDISEKPNMKFIEAERFRYMELNHIKVVVVMDFVYQDTEKGKWIIVDWKTGKESFEDRHQLALYALYIMQKFKLKSLDEIEVRNEYLLTGTSRTHQLSSVDLEKLEELFGLSVGEMLQYVADSEQNKPYGLDAFAKTEHEKKCERCNYKELCEMY